MCNVFTATCCDGCSAEEYVARRTEPNSPSPSTAPRVNSLIGINSVIIKFKGLEKSTLLSLSYQCWYDIHIVYCSYEGITWSEGNRVMNAIKLRPNARSPKKVYAVVMVHLKICLRVANFAKLFVN